MESSAIDFANLLREERRKARHKMKKKKEEEEEEQNTTAMVDVSTSRSTSHNASPPSPSPSNMHPNWNNNLPPLQSKDVKVLNSNIHMLSNDPPFLYYIDNFLPSNDHRDDGTPNDFTAELVSWLQALPEAKQHRTTARGGDSGGGTYSSSTAMKNDLVGDDDDDDDDGTDDDEYNQAHGKWTRLRYAQRRVALFDACVSPFPEPLQQLVRIIHENIWQRIPSSHHTTTEDNDDDDNGRKKKTASSKNVNSIIGPINHILINEYTETQGILGHTDGPAYDPCTATLSLESDTVLHFTPITTNHSSSSSQDRITNHQVWLAANSLVVFTHDLYCNYRHAITDKLRQSTQEHLTTSCWNGTPGQVIHRSPLRYSLTFRSKRNSTSPLKNTP